MSKTMRSGDLSRLLIQLLILPALVFIFQGCGTIHTHGTDVAPAVTLTAAPTAIQVGGTSTLTISASNANQLTITGSDGTNYTLNPSGGNQQVSPAATTTYTATAIGTGGVTTAQATVTVNGTPAGTPTVSITASPASITAGSSATLTVTATNATQVTITGDDGSSYTLQTKGGTQVVTPAKTTVFTATATGTGGTVTASATVTVTASPTTTVSISASPTSVPSGSSSTLTVGATNATQVTVTGDDGSSYTLTPNGGTQTVSPGKTTTYTAKATGPSGSVTATATVTVTGSTAPTVTISANPTSISAGSASTLTVTATNATQVTVSGSDGTSYTLQPAGGTQSVTPSATTTYTATASGAGGNATATAKVTVTAAPTVTIVATPNTIFASQSSTLKVTATNASQVTVTGTDGSSYTLAATGGNQTVSPPTTTTYTATAIGASSNASASTTLTIQTGSLQSIQHVVFMLQENHSFDNYFGMLNLYRKAKGWNVGDDGVDYEVDGLDDKLGTISNQDDEGDTFPLFKLKSTCVDDMSSDWLASFGDVSRYDFSSNRKILLDGFVHNAEGYAKSCSAPGGVCSGTFSDQKGQRAMGYYDQGFLNYYYYMASQFAISDRWFSPVATKSVGNRIATLSGGTTQGLVKDPGNDNVGQLNIPSIFQELDQNNVSWKIYYTVTLGFCTDPLACPSSSSKYPATFFSNFTYSYKYLYQNKTGDPCVAPTQPSSVVGDSSNSFCVDPTHIAPMSKYYSDLTNNTLPSFAFIEAGYGNDDEHPGSGQSVLFGQSQSANVINALMTSPSWSSSAFFFSFDEGGGPYDHVPPVPGHSNDYTSPGLSSSIPDISQIAVNPDAYYPCVPPGGTPTLHCDLSAQDPGAKATDVAAQQGFAAQLGFRLPNIVVSPFVRKHFVSHTPMDHTAVIKFVENRFIGSSAHLTPRDAAQSNLLEFFDFSKAPWITPPSPPAPVTATSLGYDPCTPDSMGP